MEVSDDILDVFLWNEQSDIVDALFPEVEAKYPEIELWYEVKGDPSVFISKGAVVLQYRAHTWLGCPEGTSIRNYLEKIMP